MRVRVRVSDAGDGRAKTALRRLAHVAAAHTHLHEVEHEVGHEVGPVCLDYSVLAPPHPT